MNQQLDPRHLPSSPAKLAVLAIARSSRLPFLILTPACVLLGVGTAVGNGASIDTGQLLLIMLSALLAHVSVNTLNEYHDFNSGLDFKTCKTPFSGGSGVLPNDPERAKTVLGAGIVSLLAVVLIGLYFIREYGLQLMPLGAAGVALIIYYTGWINRHPLLCLISPGLGFGVLMVLGTDFLLQGKYSATACLSAVVPFCLVNNLLLLNQYPDISADAEAGRRHFPIVYGIKNSNRVYAAFLTIAAATILLGVASGFFPSLSLAALLPMPLGLYALAGASKHKSLLGLYAKYLAANTALTIIVPVLLAISFIVGS